MIGALLKDLGLTQTNAGTWSGAGGWLDDASAKIIESVNPATGEVIARVRATTPAQYEQVLASAVVAAKAWRTVPAPKRGEAVRLMGDELRKYKSELGSLVSLEMGKIKPEGDGEVQEMIDIADFAVGQSRMLYGVQMHSERPNHRMFEQWHPLGVVGVISAFNFPVAVWSWNAFLAAICGNVTVWKPSPKTALCAVAVQHLCNRVLERHGLPPIFQLFIDEPRPRRACHRLRRRGDRRPALHDDAPRVRARIADAGTRAPADWSVQAGSHRRSARTRHLDGPADRRRFGRPL